jgi:hypothetical protein
MACATRCGTPPPEVQPLFVLPHLDDNGGNRMSLHLACALSDRGDQAPVFCLRERVAPSLESDVAKANVVFGLGANARMSRMLPQLLAILLPLALRCDLIVSGFDLGEGPALAFAMARMARKPLAVMIQTDVVRAMAGIYPRDRRAARYIYPRVDAALCVSPAVGESAAGLGVPRSRVHVPHFGVDLDHIRAMAEQPPSLPVDDRPLLAALGRLDHPKGFDILIRAHAAAQAEGEAHRLVILGEGSDRPALEALVRDLGVDASVALPGHVANPYPILARASALCVSSHYEGLSLAAIEALALGIPVIATDCGGPAYVLEGGAFGDLVEVGSVPALAEALVQHLRAPERLRRKAELGREHAARFSIRSAVDEHRALFQEIVGQRVKSRFGAAARERRRGSSQSPEPGRRRRWSSRESDR